MVDVESISLVGGYATRRCVRLDDESVGLQLCQIVANRRRRDIEVTQVKNDLRADSLARADVLLYESFENLGSAVIEHPMKLAIRRRD